MNGLTIHLPIPTDEALGLGRVTPETPSNRLALTRARILILARGIDGTELNPDRLGWLAFWSRAFLSVDNAASCLESHNRLSLAGIERVCIDLLTQVRAVLRPALVENKLQKQLNAAISTSDTAWAAALSRLRAYVAWCLTNDRDTFRGELSRLHRVYNPRSANELMSDPSAAEAYERLYGPIPDSEHQLLRSQKEREAARFNELIDRNHQWLQHPDLQPWTTQIKDAAHEQSRDRSFFRLVGDEESSVAKQLRADQRGLIYPRYSDASNLLHGSSLESFVTCADRICVPRVSDDAECDSFAKSIVYAATEASLVLSLIRPRLWPTAT